MSKKTLILISCLVLSLTIGLGGSLAYLTDTASQVNTFTMGGVSIDLTEEFEQGAALKPGKIIPKKPIITNSGDKDAWVWLTWEIPSVLDVWNPNGIEGADKNVIHWNFLGATSADYLGNQTYLDKAIAAGHLPAGTTVDQIQNNKTYWTYFPTSDNKADGIQKIIDDIVYNVYVVKYNKVLKPNEATLPSIVQVYLDDNVDMDTEGNLYFVENGVKTSIDWNINPKPIGKGTPKIIVNAYAIQAEGFDTVEAAYAAYNEQWPEGTQTDDQTENDETTGDNTTDGSSDEDEGVNSNSTTDNAEGTEVETEGNETNKESTGTDDEITEG